MGLMETARGAMDVIRTVLIPEASVTVVSNGVSCSGVIGTLADVGDLDAMGEKGKQSGVVYVNADDITAPSKGATILVGSSTVKVTNVNVDSVNAVLAIEYIVTQPVE